MEAQGSGGDVWELPGGVQLSENEMQLLALAEEVRAGGMGACSACRARAH